MYNKTETVKYSDLDTTLTASFPAMLRFFQNAAIDHSRIAGFPLRRLYGENHAWILISVNAEFTRYPEEGEKFFVKTWTTGYDRVFGNRAFLLTDEKGMEIAKASTVWVFTDTKSKKPCRVNESIVKAYKIEDTECLPFLRREIDLYKGKEVYKITASKRDSDTNNHVNNVRLSEFLFEALPLGSKVKSTRLFYRSSVLVGDTVTAFVHLDNNNYTVLLENDEGKLMCSAYFEMEI